ncbi:peptidylprolyl isomerase [Paenibacillus sp. CC-CFT747]|nr:peptidylprolyl isomerase [Paenibacillus sp. CC-CFT747]
MRKVRLVSMVGLLVLAGLLASGCGQAKNEGSAGASTPPSQSSGGQAAGKSWSKAPEMKIDQNKSYQAQVDTSKGSFTMDLFAKEAPITVNNFVFLAKENFYNGIKFHRIIKEFMVQTGDPLGTGAGGPGYTIKDERNMTHSKYDEGIVAMARTRAPNSAGSQFFICTGPSCAGLNAQPDYAIFGKVSQGMDTVQKIASTPVKMAQGSPDQTPSQPTEEVVIKSVKIIEK